MLIGEGLGMLVLKRLEDAERDGDRIYAVIKGIGTSSDGRFKSVYAPRPSGQALAMNRAYQDAGYAPTTVGLIEAHGTGTGAGDPTEFTSMQMVFGADNPQKQHIALGSVKSQIGHTKAAAGAAGMVKAVLSLHHKVLPPTINVEQPNSKFDIQNSAIYINTEPRPWLRNGHPRRAGVSAFGFGGINVHVALEEYEGNKAVNYRLHQPYKTIFLQADNPSQLQQACRTELDKLQAVEGTTAFQQLLKSSEEAIPTQNQARLGFVVKDLEACIELLQIAVQTLQSKTQAWSHPKGIYYRPNGIDTTTQKVVALFSGQGSQYVGMGKESANAFPQINQTFEQADSLFHQNKEAPLSKVIFPIPAFSKEEKEQQQQALTQTQFAQPAIGALSMGQYKVFQQAGLQAHFTAGHSFGELTALWAAGVYDDATFLALAKTRGAAMATASESAASSTMLAVKGSQEQVQQAIAAIDGVHIANVNSNKQVVLGGGTEAIKRAETQLSAQGLSVIPLPVSAAFHTEFVKEAQQPFSVFVQKQKFQHPQIPVYSNTTGAVFPSNLNELKSLLKEQILNPVLFKNQIDNIYQAGGRIFVEFGPKGVLTNLVKDILQGKDHEAIAINPRAKLDSDMQLRQAALQLRILGIALNKLDPFKRELSALPAKTKLDVQLSGNNYVSAGTQKAYQDALNDGIKISGGGTTVVEKVVEVEKIVEVEKLVEVQVSNPLTYQNENEEEMINREVLQLLQATLDSFKTNQTKSLEIFERFMQEQNQQAQQILQLLSEQMAATQQTATTHPVQEIQAAPTVVAEKAFPLEMKTNGNGNGNGNGAYAKTVVAASAPSPQIKANPVASPTAPAADCSQLASILLEVVSEKTGYPAEMLELSMDMEADLGIDSIKRVEIFGALTQQYPEMSDINPNELTELRTLGEIVDYVGQKGGNAVAQQAVATPAAPVQAQAPAAPVPAAPTAPAGDSSQLATILLEVVSEKTGYPAEMLELSMDMEADLGIDSIKRVEIFGALTQQYPEMSDINPNELTELRTLGEIVTYVGQKGGNAVAQQAVATPAAPVQAQAPVAPVQAAAPTAPAGDSSQLATILLEVVSEKTGYPAEMLELSMDMEADLGIDSIKRVEIFGALTQQYPEMSDINPNELTELRTLGEIVTYVGQKGGMP